MEVFDKHLHLKHDVLSAIWSDDTHKWVVKIKNLTTGEIFTETADFFITAAGRLNVPKYPNIPTLQTDYKGILVHTAEWTEELTRLVEGKRVAIIGNGFIGVESAAFLTKRGLKATVIAPDPPLSG